MEVQTRVHIWTQVVWVWSQSVPLPSAMEVDGGAEWCDQTSTTSKLVEQLHSSLTEAAEAEDAEEYLPVSRYRSPDDWTTSDWTTGLDTERRMERSCLCTAKHVDTVFLTWELIDMSESKWIPRSRTAADGITKSAPTRSGACGSWWSRRLVADQRISVFAAFSWRRFERIHSATWSMHVEMSDCSSRYADGRQLLIARIYFFILYILIFLS